MKISPTILLEVPRLVKRLGVDIVIVTETFQPTGSVKIRAAYNIVSNVSQDLIITTSSGNFGQALAYSCLLLGKSCIIVMPSTASRTKIEAIYEYGGKVELVSGSVIDRKNRLAELASEYPHAYITSAHNDPLGVIGLASLGDEISAFQQRFDMIITPIGGGGLAAGILSNIRGSGNNIRVWGAEPALANDAALSLKAGRIISLNAESQTIADGARANNIGRNNWPILRDCISGIIEVPEEHIKEAVRLLFSFANLKAEPTGALSLGALLTKPDLFYGHSACCIISGGNVDSDIYLKIIAGHA